MFKIILVGLLCLLVAAIIFEAGGPLDTRSLFAEAAGTSLLVASGVCFALLIIAHLLGDEGEHYE